jgi:hypothetical protein
MGEGWFAQRHGNADTGLRGHAEAAAVLWRAAYAAEEPEGLSMLPRCVPPVRDSEGGVSEAALFESMLAER